MKTLEELKTEVELGFKVYCHTNPEIDVYRDVVDGPQKEDQAVYFLVLPGRSPSGCGEATGYPTFDSLLSDALIPEVTAPVWSTLPIAPKE